MHLKNERESMRSSFKKRTVQGFKTIPFFWLLVPVFFLLKNYSIYYGFIPAYQLPWLFIKYLSISVLVYLITRLISKKTGYKAAFYTLILLTYYFFYNSLDQHLTDHYGTSSWNRYRYTLPLLFIVLTVLIITVRKLTAPPRKTIAFFNVMLTLFCLIELIGIGGKIIHPPKLLVTINNKVPLTSSRSSGTTIPNIYFLLFDEYQGNAGLKDIFHYDNSPLMKKLRQQHFFVPAYSRSNYDLTFFSMPSILNMNYVDGEIRGHNREEDFLKTAASVELFKHTAVMDFFRQKQYDIINLSPFILEPHNDCISKYRSVTFYKDIVDIQCLDYVMIQKFGWLLDNRAWLSLTGPQDFNNQFYNKEVQTRLIRELTATRLRPKFVYAHFFIPHAPWLFDSAGKEVSLKYQILKQEDQSVRDSLYMGYLRYGNSILSSIVTQIIDRDPGAIILFMSDHGDRRACDPAVNHFLMNNQFAIRIPGADYANWPDTVDGVNAFRLLLNNQFGQQLNYLPYRQTFYEKMGSTNIP